MIARRALLALGAGFAAAIWPAGPSDAQPRAKWRAQHANRHPRIIAIDPGHGGVDPGAISPRGIYEKTLTLLTARELVYALMASGRYRTVLTRYDDRFVSLRDRVARARANRADLFLSIHADMLPDSAMRGLSVYTLSDQASDRETAALAVRENRDDFVGGLRLSRQPHEIGAILLDLARRETNNRSLILARTIVTELGRTVTLLDTPHRSAGFAVLNAPDTPSALVELGCLSNPRDERLLLQPAHRQRLAHGLARAIDDYFAAVSAV